MKNTLKFTEERVGNLSASGEKQRFRDQARLTLRKALDEYIDSKGECSWIKRNGKSHKIKNRVQQRLISVEKGFEPFIAMLSKHGENKR